MMCTVSTIRIIRTIRRTDRPGITAQCDGWAQRSGSGPADYGNIVPSTRMIHDGIAAASCR
jgi:hypothetical protein